MEDFSDFDNSLPNRIKSFTKAAIALHNFLQTTESSVYCPAGFVDGEDGSRNLVEGSWRRTDGTSGLSNVNRVSANWYALPTDILYCMYIIVVYGIHHCSYSRTAASIISRIISTVNKEKCIGSIHMFVEQINNNYFELISNNIKHNRVLFNNKSN